jgi:hypothetical protein
LFYRLRADCITVYACEAMWGFVNAVPQLRIDAKLFFL